MSDPDTWEGRGKGLIFSTWWSFDVSDLRVVELARGRHLEFAVLPQDWETHIGKNAALIAAFHKAKPGLLDAMPQEPSARAGAWPRLLTNPVPNNCNHSMVCTWLVE